MFFKWTLTSVTETAITVDADPSQRRLWLSEWLSRAGSLWGHVCHLNVGCSWKGIQRESGRFMSMKADAP